MIDIKCDICNKECGKYQINELEENYRVGTIKDVCNQCYYDIRKFQDKAKQMLREFEMPWTRRMIMILLDRKKK